MEDYRRRQSLLRTSSGEAISSVVMQRRTGRCLIDLTPFSPFPPGSKICQIDADEVFLLGDTAGERALHFDLPAIRYRECACIGVCTDEKLLFTEGAPEDFQGLRLLFLRHLRAQNPPPAPKESPEIPKPSSPLEMPPVTAASNAPSIVFPSHMDIETLLLPEGLLCLREALSEDAFRSGVLSPASAAPPPGLIFTHWENGVWWDDSGK